MEWYHLMENCIKINFILPIQRSLKFTLLGHVSVRNRERKEVFLGNITYFKRTYKLLLRVLLNVIDIDIIPFTEYI